MLAALLFLGMLLAGFLAAALAVSFAWAVVEVRGRRRRPGPQAAPARDAPSVLRRDESLSTIRVWAALLERIGHVHLLRRHIADAGLAWSPGRVTLLMLLAAALAYLLFSTPAWIPRPIAAAVALLAGLAPYLYIRRRRARRFARFAAQFPEALDSLARALKAGYPLAAGIELLGLEHPEPLGAEMRRTRDEWKLGVAWDQAFDQLANRVPIPEVRLFAAAVTMQNRVGGRLNDVLGRLAETMREAAALEGEVRSISVHSRLTGVVLSVLPLAIAAVMLAVSPTYLLPLFESPTGRLLLVSALAANVAAHFIIRHLATVRP